jgi:metallothiol transferase
METVMIKTKDILHFTISVTDLARSTKFYQELLGCELTHENPIMSFMKCGNMHFVLTKMDNHVAPNPPRETLFHHAFIVDRADFDDAMEEIKRYGVEILMYDEKGHRAFPGRHAYFHDPDGNAIEIIDLRLDEKTEGDGPESLLMHTRQA